MNKKAIKSILLQVFEICCHILPVSSKKIFFQSFAGQYNDNPKAISEKLHELYPEIKQYWVLSEKSKCNDIPQYLTILKYNSYKSIYVKNRCKVIVENGSGYYYSYCKNTYALKFKKKLKNKKQFELSTWHGNPIKHIGAQIPGCEKWEKKEMFTSSDMLLAGCKQIQSIFEKAFFNLMPVSLLGTPRTDILFSNNEIMKNRIREKLGLPDKKIILYAPTYRYNPQDSGLIQLQLIDLNKLLSTLNVKFGGDWIFVMRVHNMVLLEIERSGILHQYKDVLFNGNRFDDMNEYLYVSDVLLTDYSGCIYDVALTNKPCFLFAHDKDNYERKERGLYTSLNDFPYLFANSFDELISIILDYDSVEYNKQRMAFLQKIGNIEDGNASLRIVNLIDSKIKNKKHE